MKRSGPIKRNKSLREAYAQRFKDKRQFFRTLEREIGKCLASKPRKRLPVMSAKQKARHNEYMPVQRQFLSLPRNQWCGVCLARGRTPNPATEVHHKFGRRGTLLCDVRGFIPSCFDCRTWPHDNINEARRLGVLGEKWEWDRPIDEHAAENERRKKYEKES